MTNLRLETWSPPCPLCGGIDFQLLVGDDRYGMGVQTAGCLRCGLIQTWPRPTPDAMAKFYRDDYREYYQATPAPDADYALRYRKDERLAYTAQLLSDNVGLATGMRVLDIGCAEGTLFAKLAQLCAGLRFVGVEPSETFAAYARQETGCATYPHLGALLDEGEGGFDLVIVNHVLEHTDDPVALLSRIAGLMSPLGRLYVDVPDADRYESVENLHIAHLFHFSPRTLAATIARAGFEARATNRHEPPHHPRSVWYVSQPRGELVSSYETSVETERVAWEAMGRLRRALPLHRLRRRLARNRVAVDLIRAVRALRRCVRG